MINLSMLVNEVQKDIIHKIRQSISDKKKVYWVNSRYTVIRDNRFVLGLGVLCDNGYYTPLELADLNRVVFSNDSIGA